MGDLVEAQRQFNPVGYRHCRVMLLESAVALGKFKPTVLAHRGHLSLVHNGVGKRNALHPVDDDFDPGSAA